MNVLTQEKACKMASKPVTVHLGVEMANVDSVPPWRQVFPNTTVAELFSLWIYWWHCWSMGLIDETCIIVARDHYTGVEELTAKTRELRVEQNQIRSHRSCIVMSRETAKWHLPSRWMEGSGIGTSNRFGVVEAKCNSWISVTVVVNLTNTLEME